MKGQKRTFHYGWRHFLIALAMLFMLVMGTLYLWLRSEDVQQRIFALAQTTLADSLGLRLEAEDFYLHLPLEVTAHTLTLSDAKGVWLEGRDLRIGLVPSLTMLRHLWFYRVRAEELILQRLPELSTSTDDDTSAPDITLSHIAIARLSLAPAVTGLSQPLDLSLYGHAAWNVGAEKIEYALRSDLRQLPFSLPQDAMLEVKGHYMLQTQLLSNDVFLLDAGDALHAEGNAVLDMAAGTVTGVVDANVTSLAAWHEALAGSITGSTEIEGALAHPTLRGKGTSKTLRYKEKVIPDAEWQFQFRGVSDGGDGTLKIAALEKPETHHASVDYHFRGAALTLDSLALRYDACRLHGKASLAGDFSLHDVSVDGDCGDRGHGNISITPAPGEGWAIMGDISGTDPRAYALRARGVLHPQAEGALDGVLDSLDASYAGHRLEHLQGKVTLSAAQLGQVTLTGGKYRYVPLGLALDNVTASLAVEQGRVLLQKLAAQDKDGHPLTVQGVLTTSGAGVAASDAKADIQDMALIAHPNARGRVTGTLTAKGDRTGASVTGTLTVRPLEIRLPEHLVQEAPELNIVTIAEDKEAIEEHYPVMFDVAIAAPNQVFVRGWGVDAELGGALALKGSAADPEVSGVLSVARGSYEEFGKRFTLKEGTLSFEGDMPPSPYLHIVGSTQAGGVEIKPAISGPMLTPKLVIESNPSLPQDEALSRLLFGKSAQAIGPLQAVQLANSLRKLSGNGGGFDPVGRARELLGVDTLKVEGNGTDASGTTVGVGKHLRDNVYLELERGSIAGTGKARIEIEVTPSISIENTTGETGQNSVGVMWKRDY